MLMSLSGSSDSRCSSWATTRLAMSWLTWVPRKMIRSLSRREEMSKERSPREVCSTTIGTRGLMVGTLSKAPGGYPPSSRLRRPERALLLLLLLRGPDLLARLGLLERDRHRRPDDQVDRLAHANVFADHRVAAILAQPLQQLLRRRPLLLGGVGQRLGHLLLGDLDLLRLGARRPHSPAPQLGFGVRFGLLDHVLTGLALHLQVGVGAHPARRQLPLDPLPALPGGSGWECLGDLDGRCRGSGVDRGEPEVLLGPLPDRLGEPRGDVAAQLLEGLELGGLGGEIVVELGQHLLPHLLHLDREDGVFAGQLLSLVVVGEGDLDLAGVAPARARQLLLEALDQLAAAKLEQVVARLAALEGLAVEQALEVDQQHVTLRRRPLDRLELGEALADALDLALDHLGRRLGLGPADLEALVLAELCLRPHPDLELEGERRRPWLT